MNTRLLPILAIGGALALAFASCSEEEVKMNLPTVQNSLLINGAEAQQVNAHCTQSSNFSISASIKNGTVYGSIGIEFPGTTPMPDTFDVVMHNPQPGQVKIQLLTDVQNPINSYISEDGEVILTFSDGGYRATFGNITLVKTDSTAEELSISGTVGCYNSTGATTSSTTSGTTTTGTTGSNTLKFGSNAATAIAPSCMAAGGAFMMAGASQTNSVTFSFATAAAPADGIYTLTSSSSGLAADEVYFVATVGSTFYDATGGQATVTTNGGKKKVAFSNVPLKESGGSATSSVTGSISCQ